MLNDANKKTLKEYGIFMAFLCGMLILLMLLTFFAQKFWVSGLRRQVSSVLELYEPGAYTVTDYVSLKTPLDSSAASFVLKNKNGKSKNPVYGIIIRIMTVYGPMPAVFTYDTSQEPEFIGFACLTQDMSDRVKGISLNSTIQYWKKRIPLLFTVAEAVHE